MPSEDDTKDAVAIVGLGSMGMGMALSALAAGLPPFGADVSQERRAQFIEQGGQKLPAQDQNLAVSAVAVVVLNAAQTEDVLFGAEGLVPRLNVGAVVLGCATVAPEFAQRMADKCAEYGVLYLDAPISGGSVKAANGQLSVMAAGAPEAFHAAAPLLDAVSERVFELGDQVGAGSAMKAVNQLLAGVHIATMAEALTFGMTQGVAPDTFLEVISECAGSSWMLENRAPHVVAGDYSPHSQVNIWPKDLGIVLEIARSNGFDAPITETALAQYRKAVDAGLGAEDDAAIAKVYAAQAGVRLPGAV